MKHWTSDQIPDQTGKIVIITGGNIGLGYEMALQLARKGATIVIACRTVEKGEKAIQNIEQSLHKDIHAVTLQLDLTDKASIHNFAHEFNLRFKQLDILINNAGVVNLKERTTTKEGLEMHMATNHLGHFALTGLLLPLLKSTPNSRVVTMSSGAHKFGNINFDDFNWEKRTYDRGKSYGDSKLANLMFTMSLQSLFNEQNCSTISVAAHPGLSATERQQSIGIGGWVTKILAQPVWKGALPALMAATDKNVKPCEYYGPKWGIRGYPMIVKMDKKAFDQDVAQRLWTLSEEITGVKF